MYLFKNRTPEKGKEEEDANSFHKNEENAYSLFTDDNVTLHFALICEIHDNRNLSFQYVQSGRIEMNPTRNCIKIHFRIADASNHLKYNFYKKRAKKYIARKFQKIS